MTTFALTALARFTAIAKRPRTAKAYRATAIRLRIAAVEYTEAGLSSFASKCADRAAECSYLASRASV